MSLNHALTAENLGVMRSAIGICLVAGESEFPTPSQGEQGSESSHLMVVWGCLNADGLSSEAVRPTHLNSRANHNARRPVTTRRHPWPAQSNCSLVVVARLDVRFSHVADADPEHDLCPDLPLSPHRQWCETACVLEALPRFDTQPTRSLDVVVYNPGLRLNGQGLCTPGAAMPPVFCRVD